MSENHTQTEVALSVENYFLLSLSPKARAEILAACQEIDLPVRMGLYASGETPRYAYLLNSGIASIVVGLVEGGSAEVGLIGAEGLVGSYHLLGRAPVQTECFMQVAGSGLRLPLGRIRELFRESEEIRERILEFVQVQALTSSQLTACNKLHEAEARLARWLLMVADREHRDTYMLTQEFLGQMLGTRRSTVALAAGVLQKSGLLDYRRGQVRILDRERLREAACDCYGVVSELLETLHRKT